MTAQPREDSTPTGGAVNKYGQEVIDPTKNVESLVKALEVTLEKLRIADKELFETKHESIKEQIKLLVEGTARYQDGQREAETRRIDELARTRQEFQNTIRDMLAESVRTTSNLVSTQLLQIQATFDTRVTKLEAGAFIAAGKSSVSDPALAETMQKMATGISNVQALNSEAMDKMLNNISRLQSTGERTEGRGMGQGQVIGWVVGAAMLLAAIVSPIVAIIALRPH